MKDFNRLEDAAPIAVIPKQKIKVFISSKCGDKGKYDNIRKELRVAIERTNLADVYTFELYYQIWLVIGKRSEK